MVCLFEPKARVLAGHLRYASQLLAAPRVEVFMTSTPQQLITRQLLPQLQLQQQQQAPSSQQHFPY
jgi:hypothetical protein